MADPGPGRIALTSGRPATPATDRVRPTSPRRFAPGIRAKVLLASSALLLIPWIGYAFVAEMVRFLNDGQTRMLADSASAVAALVQERAKVVMASPGADDLAPVAAKPITLDGYIEQDWVGQGAQVRGYGGTRLAETTGLWTAESLSFSHAVARHDDHLYAFFDVTDDRVVHCAPESPAACDHVRISVRTAGGKPRRYAVSAPAPGPIRAAALEPGGAPEDAAIEGVWRERERGYTVELRLPAADVQQIAFAVADVDDVGGVVGAVITTEERTAAPPRSGFAVSEEVAAVLDAMARANLRIWVVDRRGAVVGRAGALQPPPPSDTTAAAVRRALEPLRSFIFGAQPQVFVDPLANATRLSTPEIADALAGARAMRMHARGSSASRINAAAHPIEIGGEIAGAALVEQTTETISHMREIALERLLLATLGAFVGGALILVFYVSHVSNRLRRLRDEAERAIDSAGRIRGLVAGSTTGDEIGDLSRSYSAVLQRLAQYTDYLENLASRLNHELRTPIAVVRSSLDNLRSEAGASIYIDRAEEGLKRLSAILSRMSEATRLEDIMRRSEREMFDVDAVVGGCVEGYRVAYAPQEIRYTGPGHPVRVSGVPDLIAQMLDKLVENAAEYASAGSTIEVSLDEDDADVVLRVRNEGPPLPEAMEGGLFESMVSVPGKASGIPHLGLGLYIVKLIARFHQGSASAANTGTGVVVTVRLARYVSDPA